MAFNCSWGDFGLGGSGFGAGLGGKGGGVENPLEMALELTCGTETVCQLLAGAGAGAGVDALPSSEFILPVLEGLVT